MVQRLRVLHLVARGHGQHVDRFEPPLQQLRASGVLRLAEYPEAARVRLVVQHGQEGVQVRRVVSTAGKARQAVVDVEELPRKPEGVSAASVKRVPVLLHLQGPERGTSESIPRFSRAITAAPLPQDSSPSRQLGTRG